jgi:hypothetical protein
LNLVPQVKSKTDVIFSAEEEARKTLRILGAKVVNKSKDNPAHRDDSPEPGKKGSASRRKSRRDQPEEEEEPDEMDCSVCLRKNFLSWVSLRVNKSICYPDQPVILYFYCYKCTKVATMLDTKMKSSIQI